MSNAEMKCCNVQDGSNRQYRRSRRAVRAGLAIFLGVMCGAASLASAADLIFDWGLRHSTTTSLHPDVEHIPHPGHDYPPTHLYNRNVWTTADAGGRYVGLMLQIDTGPVYGTTDPNALIDSINWMSANGITLDYVFSDVEDADPNVVATEIAEIVSIVTTHADPDINQSRIVQYAYYPGDADEAMHWPWITNRTDGAFDYHNEYLTSGVDVANPNCYFYSYLNQHVEYNGWGSYVCPNVRSAMFWAPLERFSGAKRSLPAGHQIIPWLSGLIEIAGYEAPDPTSADRRSLLQHMRLRGADGYYRLETFATPISEEAHRAELLDAWHDLDAYFAEPGTADFLMLDTDKTSGVNWSAMRKGDWTRVLISNLSDTNATVDFPPHILELPDISPVVSAGSHVFFDYPVTNTYYVLTVNSGSGDASYVDDYVASISADAAPAGQVFDQWTGDTSGIADILAASTTLTMPAAAATVTATYKNAPSGTSVLLSYTNLTVTSWDQHPSALDDKAFNGDGLVSPDEHESIWARAWLPEFGGQAAGSWIKVDLGGTNYLDHLRVWNYNQIGQDGRGIQQADIFVALTDPGNNPDQSGVAFDPTGWTLAVEDQYFTKAPAIAAGATYTNTDPNISLGGVEAAFLAIRVDSNHGWTVSDGDVGVSEIQIYVGDGETDHDGDGLPTDWENDNGLDPDDDGSVDPDQGADGNPDLDGADNREEWIADTHPNDSNSVFVVTDTLSNPDGSVTVVLDSSSERVYLLQGTSDLSAPLPWPVLDGPTAGTGGALGFNDATATGTADRAYSVEVQFP